MDPVAEHLDASRLVIDIREDRADKVKLDDLIQRWAELPAGFVHALRRAERVFAGHGIVRPGPLPLVDSPAMETDILKNLEYKKGKDHD